jgi:hypothetical protein
MFRRLLLLAFVAFAVLGLSSPEYASAVVAEAEVAEDDGGCCPCDDDGSPDDGCCASASCACFAGSAVTHPDRLGVPDPRVPGGPAAAWAIGAEQRARDRSAAPPTRPPIG